MGIVSVPRAVVSGSCGSIKQTQSTRDGHLRKRFKLPVSMTLDPLATARGTDTTQLMTPSPKTTTIRDQVSDAEWQARVDLAAAYRLVALYGWDDLIFTHISARVPEEE